MKFLLWIGLRADPTSNLNIQSLDSVQAFHTSLRGAFKTRDMVNSGTVAGLFFSVIFIFHPRSI
ncbi:hypothetical protein LEP1GSC193_3895 [Leptospira alstonii serovar Pingchang str. 80-412]|uniref:Uncharacterized protein n=2 Tax=Leptospira alstonii TaxID=28452 RepID=M6CSL1_9LEPT|nr:hypothetical protein LEP1GSC194_4159 [Leptospira alstonii serovar Sichuan str. 79601]EQA82274.1 hypothetical protein LEP1GSC193_3895 [Leptospira alstonii serovar Pingchang str. 80-412]